MSDILNKTIVLVLNRNWQAINIRSPAEAFCQMATNVASALEIEFDDADSDRTSNFTSRTSNTQVAIYMSARAVFARPNLRASKQAFQREPSVSIGLSVPPFLL